MPFGMESYVQAVVVQGTVYVGGGYAGYKSDNYIVMEYDTQSGKWAGLPPYRACDFAMTVINNQLVLVGGSDNGPRSKVVGVWRAGRREWTYPYPKMATAREQCSAVVYNEWLVVAGGRGDRWGVLSSVEVMNTDSKQWYVGPPIPTGWNSMKTAIVGDMCYFMGGYIGVPGASYTTPTDMVYRVSLPALISQLHSQESRKKGGHYQLLWKEISGLQLIRSTPLSISAWVLACIRWLG